MAYGSPSPTIVFPSFAPDAIRSIARVTIMGDRQASGTVWKRDEAPNVMTRPLLSIILLNEIKRGKQTYTPGKPAVPEREAGEEVIEESGNKKGVLKKGEQKDQTAANINEGRGNEKGLNRRPEERKGRKQVDTTGKYGLLTRKNA